MSSGGAWQDTDKVRIPQFIDQARTWAFAPKNSVGQRTVAAREQNKDPPIDQARILGRRAHHLGQGGNVEIFVVSNELLKTNSNKFKMSDDNVVVQKESIRLLLK